MTHPSVFLAPFEVPAFEDPDYRSLGLQPMRRLLGQAAGDQLVGIKRPDYLAFEQVAYRLQRHVPDARLIALLRNPIERAVSAYYHYMLEGHVPVRPLDKGLPAILQRSVSSRYPRAREILDFGLYGQQIALYRSFFSKSQLLLLLHEDYVRDVPATLKRVGDRWVWL